MSERTVYVNGRFCGESEATVSIFDRGFLFADAVYEVTAVIDGRLIDFAGHMARLKRSLGELAMPVAIDEDELLEIHRELVRRNEIAEGLVYMQISRGAADRDFHYPDRGTPATMAMFTQVKAVIDNPSAERGLKIVSAQDLRWGRRDIKTVQLLYPSMAKMEAKEKGADDAWLVENGYVNEATSANAHIVSGKTIVTRSLSHSILHGITRKAVLSLAREAGMAVEERAFTIEEAQGALEAFVTSATAFVTPVVEIDGKPVGDGKAGPVARRLRSIYIEESRKSAI